MAVELDSLTREELQRYSRHLILPEIGVDGQRALKAARVLLIGAGGLGSPLALYLTAAGVGTIGIVDDDAVDLTNLQRQVLHGSSQVGRSKILSAQQRLADLNPDVKIVPFQTRLTRDNVTSILAEFDIVADGSDNFTTRYIVNDACVALEKINVYGSVYRFEGQASVFDARKGPCYRCLFPQPPQTGASCSDVGVLGVLPGIIGLIQATEVLKLITGAGESLIGRLLLFDALEMRFRELKLVKDAQCPACGIGAQPTTLAAAANGETQAHLEISALDLREKLGRGEAIELLDVREPVEREIAKLANTREIPLGELSARLHELPQNVPIVAYCYSGARSASAVQQLRAAGFADVKNLRGGILAWMDAIDPTLTRY
ncbi:MAG: molybdopterin-synthase adenylyltransferase MoeB [Candidatus Eremiobacteraeota bacterium]|nr:molybdopterin-synthase adenylyltransferase MoeB [Candidatus Eremiobacteraeota bacterium]